MGTTTGADPIQYKKNDRLNPLKWYNQDRKDKEKEIKKGDFENE